MVKNFRCPGCGATVEYDPKDGKMHCPYCRSAYDPEKIGKKLEKATIRMNIAVCNSCGAELAVNAVEVSSFCPYCGNAAVVMDRVEDRLAPDYILPFKVTKEEAETLIRDRMKRGFCVPNGIKNFELEKLNGIYIPFWLYDIYYGAEQVWSYKVRIGKATYTRYEHIAGDCSYKWMTVDASRALNDQSSRRLEPYDMRALKPFNASYLSGFYSDRYDVDTSEADQIADYRAQKMFDKGMKEMVGYSSAGLLETKPVERVLGSPYALLPVWFLTFRHEEQPYTILVNGQTRKMVGAVPCSKKKVLGVFLALAMVFCTLFGMFGAFLENEIVGGNGESHTSYYYTVTGEKYAITTTKEDMGGIYLFLLVAMLIIACILLYYAIKKIRMTRKSIELSRCLTNHRLAKERTERE